MYRLVRTTTGRILHATFDHERHVLAKSWRKKTLLESLHRFYDNMQRLHQMGTVLSWNSPESYTARTDSDGWNATMEFTIEKRLL